MTAQLVGKALFFVHSVLALWGFAGLVEWLAPRVPWPTLTNPDLTRPILLVHWLAMIGAGLAFVAGYATAWPRTPYVMIGAYAVLATICAVETFGYLTSERRFVAMAAEYTAYVTILALLFRLEGLRAHFGG